MAKIFHIETTASGVVPSVTRIDPKDLKDNLSPTLRYKSIQQWSNRKIPFAKDKTRNAHVHLFGCEGNRWALPFDFLVDKLIKDYEEEGFTAAEIIATVQSAYKRNEHEHGKFLIEPPIPKDNDSDSVGEWISAKQLYDRPMPTDVWLLEDLIRKGFTLVTSPPGVGKSTLLRQFGLSICYLDDRFAGKQIYRKFRRICYIAREESWEEVKESFDQQVKALNLTLDDKWMLFLTQSNDVNRVLIKIEKKHKENPFDAIFLDSYNAFYLGSGKQTTDTLGQRDMADMLDSWARVNNVALIGIHHPIKSNYSEEPTLQAISGAGGLSERMRALLSICELRSEREDAIYLTVTKGNLIRPIHRRQYIEIARGEEGTWLYHSTGRIIPKAGYQGIDRETKKQDNIEKRKKIITEIFTANGSLQHGKFCEVYKESTGLSLVSGSRHLAEMVKEDVIVHDEITGFYSLKVDEQVINSLQPLTNIESTNKGVMEWVDENYDNCPF